MFDGVNMAPPRQHPVLGGITLVAVLLALTLVSYAVLDKPFADFSHQFLARPQLARWLSELGDARALGGIGVIVCLVASFTFPKVAKAFATALLAFGLAMLTVAFLKHGFGRTWPETWVDNNPSWVTDRVFGFNWMHGGQGYQSFPSGHTARTMAPCAVLWVRMPRLKYLWMSLPLVVGLGLLGANFHFVSDCFGGALLGVIAAHTALYLAPKIGLG
jgi:membrane-associated phospholipid phosphatase